MDEWIPSGIMLPLCSHYFLCLEICVHEGTRPIVVVVCICKVMLALLQYLNKIYLFPSWCCFDRVSAEVTQEVQR